MSRVGLLPPARVLVAVAIVAEIVASDASAVVSSRGYRVEGLDVA